MGDPMVFILYESLHFKCFVNIFLHILYLTIKKKNPAHLDAEPLLKQTQIERPRVLDHVGFPKFPL